MHLIVMHIILLAGGASTQSLNLSEEDVPPPLPQKHGSVDYGNSASNDAINTLPKRKLSQSVYKVRNSHRLFACNIIEYINVTLLCMIKVNFFADNFDNI